MRISLLAAVIVLALGSGLARAAGSGGRDAQAWASAQIAAVVGAGAMGPDVASFRATDPLTRGELYDAVAALGLSVAFPSDPTRFVSMRELDAQLVAALGLLPAAKRIRVAARDAGLEPTSMLGTETVARLLGLRLNHPQDQEQLELGPGQPATRAEAAYSLARVLQLTSAEIDRIETLALDFTLPDLDDLQRAVLSRALRLVGNPYVWAGSSERQQQLWSATAPGGLVTAPGGFDCSGFVWRVFKLEPIDGAPGLQETLQGRTSYAMSAEVPRSARIAFGALAPADVVFFGARGPKSKPADVDHMGIYVGNGWLVHSSSRGVALEPMTGWYETRFAWARRPLAEVGLVGGPRRSAGDEQDPEAGIPLAKGPGGRLGAIGADMEVDDGDAGPGEGGGQGVGTVDGAR